jgi:type I restriction enzyme, R subunit
MPAPEQLARQNIDRMLEAAGWLVQDMKTLNPGAAPGVAVREYPTDTGPADYALLVDRNPVGIIEAKKEGVALTAVQDQAGRYATSALKYTVKSGALPFVFESTGIETRFTDNRDPKPRARGVFSFPRPETLKSQLESADTFRKRLKGLPALDPAGLRTCQINAITRLEESLAHNRPKALVQMATGSGKTFTAITSVYRLLKHAKAKRILFLVDTKNLGEQTEQEFQMFKPNDDNRKFTELYSVQRLSSNSIGSSNQVCISTIQRMYSILKGESLDESAEQEALFETQVQSNQAREVAYNPKYPPEFFDIVIVDECHRSIYNLWKQVLDYFDAFLIGLTATPDSRTFAFFNENVVSEYSHEDAVADGVNVPYDIFTIETEITQRGSRIAAKEFVDHRSRQTRRNRWAQLDEEFTYTGTQLDRDVVNPSQIRNIVRTLKERLQTEIFPDRKEVPKTLIFAKTDSHADDIIQIVREEFGEGNEFCKKVTCNPANEDDPKTVLQSFRNEYYPRVAVTVDMIATGTDVRPLEVLLFMRDVRSRNYFEQMKGRGTRIQDLDNLRKVSPSATTDKTHFVIVDAVGVCKSVKTESRALERKRDVPLKDLMLNVVMGARDEDTMTSLGNRLARLNHQLDPKEQAAFKEKTGGKTLPDVVHGLFDAHNPDRQVEVARQRFNLQASAQPNAEQIQAAQNEMALAAAQVFDNADLRTFVDNARRSHEQVIDKVNTDTVLFAGFDAKAKEQAEALVQDFQTYITAHRDTITALGILYAEPYRRRELTYQMIRDLCDTLRRDRPRLVPFIVWQAYERLEKVAGQRPENELVALVSLLRRVLNIDSALTPFDAMVNRNFMAWTMDRHKGNAPKFTEEQMEWLRLIKDHIATSMHIDRDDFEFSPFVEKGGLGKAWQLFLEGLDPILDELNTRLLA